MLRSNGNQRVFEACSCGGHHDVRGTLAVDDHTFLARNASWRGDLQARNREPQRPLPGLVDHVASRTHDALPILPHGLADRIVVRVTLHEHVVVRVVVILQRHVWYVGDDGALHGTRAEQAGAALAERAARRRTRGGPFLCLRPRLGDESCGVLVARFKAVDNTLLRLLAFLALLLFEAAELRGAQLALLPLGLFLLLEVALVLFFPLDIERNEGRILYSVLSDASFSLGYVNVVDEVEG